MRNKLTSEIRKYYSETLPCPDRNAMCQTIIRARQAMREIQYTEDTVSFFDFFIAQTKFIRKKVWVMQFLVLLFIGIILMEAQEAVSAIGLISAVMPLIFLSWTKELSRAFIYDTAEVEMSTRFTLHQVMMSRITLMGLTDIFVLTLTVFIAADRLSLKMPHIFMYLCVPFLITAVGCLCILNHVHAKEHEYYCAAWCVAVMITAFFLSKWASSLYEASLISIWYISFAVSLALAVMEFSLLLKNCTKKHYFKNITTE